MRAYVCLIFGVDEVLFIARKSSAPWKFHEMENNCIYYRDLRIVYT